VLKITLEQDRIEVPCDGDGDYLSIYGSCENPILSILICHLPERTEFLNKLLFRLRLQVLRTPVEIIVASHGRGISIGRKRNILVDASTGKYVAFIDDDDMVAFSYVSNILEAVRNGVDCIGITGKYLEKNKPDWSFRHSITVGWWCKDKQLRIYYRSPNHLNPIKRELVAQCQFPEISFGEDKVFSDAIKPLLRTERFIEEPIYYYHYVKNK
jgi:glycosyltransferase involved in cell wall biosynthesis